MNENQLEQQALNPAGGELTPSISIDDLADLPHGNEAHTEDYLSVTEVQNNLYPQGAIVMWPDESPPEGWAVCDGSNGTPDLRDLFILGAGDTYSSGDTGGEKEHQLTIAEMPSHSHGYRRTNRRNSRRGNRNYNTRQNPMSFRNTNTGSTGGDQPHENRPPYYALKYIMRL